MTHLRRAILAPTALLALLLVGGCAGGGGGASSDSSGASSASSAGGAAAGSLGEMGSGKAAPTRTSAQNAVAPMSRAVISQGELTLHSADLPKARASVIRMVAGWGGTVADEQTSGDRRGRLTDSTLKLRVPSARFDQAMRELAGVGEVEQQSRSAEDVTTQVIDNNARVRAAQRSIRSIENLLSRATKLGDVIAIENDLAQRQADLDSLEQQQAYLADQTSLSTITVNLSLPEKVLHPSHEARGFLAGLVGGWHAFGTAVAVVLTALGAVLPFAVVLALVGVPVWRLLRRRRPVVVSSEA